MAEPISLDPFALVRDLVAQIEKKVNEAANPIMTTDGFAKNANRLMSAALVAKKLAQDLTQRYFEALNVPSRTDLLLLGDRLQAIEDRMIGMEATLNRLAGGGSGRPGLPAPVRTRRPPAPVIEVVAAPAPKRTRKVKS